MDSILVTIKKMLGLDEFDDSFDIDIITLINSVIVSLSQMGIGPSSVYIVTSKDDKWIDFLGENSNLEAIKTYMFLKVKMTFDPPSNPTVIKSMQDTISEIQWRSMLSIESDSF